MHRPDHPAPSTGAGIDIRKDTLDAYLLPADSRPAAAAQGVVPADADRDPLQPLAAGVLGALGRGG
jgi:hypothetical protein